VNPSLQNWYRTRGSGQEHWRNRLRGNFSASPLHAAGHVYFQNEAGQVIVVRAGTTFAEVARNQLGDGARTFVSYAVDSDDLLVHSESTLYRIRR